MAARPSLPFLLAALASLALLAWGASAEARMTVEEAEVMAQLLPDAHDVLPRNNGAEMRFRERDQPAPEHQNKFFKIDHSQDRCIICQYLVQRMVNNVVTAGLMPHAYRHVDRGEGVEKEPSTNMDNTIKVPSLVEVSSTATAKSQQIPLPNFVPQVPYTVYPPTSTTTAPYHVPPASFMYAPAPQGLFETPQPISANDQLDRLNFQISNNIGMVVADTLDHSCEESMPNEYIRFCKDVTSVQHVVTSLISRNFQPVDICMRIDQCNEKSYVHTLFKHTPALPPPRKETPKILEEGSK